MNVWAKMMTALRVGATEISESKAEGNALTILDQEVRDSSEALKEARNSLASLLTRQKASAESCLNLEQKISEHEGYALKALRQGDEDLALEVAEEIVQIEKQLESERDVSQEMLLKITNLQKVVQQADHNISRLKQQADTVRATESVQRAQASVAERYSGSHSNLRTAIESLHRIKEKQAIKAEETAAVINLENETNANTLRGKLEAAGILQGGHSANDVLLRLKHPKSDLTAIKVSKVVNKRRQV